MERNDPCWCGSGLKWKKCHFPAKNSNPLTAKYLKQYGILLKTPEQIAGIREACRVTAQILDALCRAAKAGVTTNELDRLSCDLHAQYNARAAPLGYGDPPYPKSICTSLNEVICHGIPNDRPLQEGDICNIDVSAIVGPYYGDASRMVHIGALSEEKQRVLDTSLECLKRAIAICRPGTPIKRIGDAIEEYARLQRCSVVNQFVGHGVGVEFHEPPEIPHHYNDIWTEMAPGMTFTIEPMINAGVREGVLDPSDGWTVRTRDLKPSAQWEHTLLITENGCEVLTAI